MPWTPVSMTAPHHRAPRTPEGQAALDLAAVALGRWSLQGPFSGVAMEVPDPSQGLSSSTHDMGEQMGPPGLHPAGLASTS